MRLDLEKVSQLKQTWSDIIPESGCNIESCRAIIQDFIGKKISSKVFYAKLLKNDIVREGPQDDGYIRDYYQMLEVFGLNNVKYERTFDFNSELIIDLLNLDMPVKGMCKTISGTHFFLIDGFEHIGNDIYFTVIDPMERDSYINPENWKLFYVINDKFIYTGRKLARIEWFS